MVSSQFQVPTQVVTDLFLVRPLVVGDAKADYEAWTSSIEHLQGIFGPNSSWPSLDMTLEDNAIDLAWHQREYEIGSSFAYTVFNTDNTVCLGCVYVGPARKVGYDAEVFYWVRANQADKGLDKVLGAFVHDWISKYWPFTSVVYPGRSLSWAAYLPKDDKPHW